MSLVNKLLTDLEEQEHSGAPTRKQPDVLNGLRATGRKRKSNFQLQYQLKNLLYFLLVFAVIFTVVYGLYWLVDQKEAQIPEKVTAGPTQAITRLPAIDPKIKEEQTGQRVEGVKKNSAPTDKSTGKLDKKNTKKREDKKKTPDRVPQKKQTSAAKSNSKINKQKSVAVKQRQSTPAERADRLYQEAKGLQSRGRMAEAEVKYLATLEIDPAHLAARNALVQMQVDSKRWIDALENINRGLFYSPLQEELLFLKGRILYEQGAFTEALATLESLDAVNVKNADYLALLAYLLQRDEEYLDAAAVYRLALQKRPHEGPWWLGLGVSLESTRDLKAAKDAYVRALGDQDLANHLSSFVQKRLAYLRELDP